jgi:UDP-N-acetylglucosamine--N-acetylmuramyl-(pentapeptide) pyrophosphoryl-undecaprenol N-acetylglucosamine transferase
MAMRKLYFEDYKNIILILFKLFLYRKNGFCYAAADIIISRAGASSVSGIMYWKPVFYSFSNVAEDHQTKNAKLLLIKGALLLKESELESQFSLVLKHY